MRTPNINESTLIEIEEMPVIARIIFKALYLSLSIASIAIKASQQTFEGKQGGIAEDSPIARVNKKEVILNLGNPEAKNFYKKFKKIKAPRLKLKVNYDNTKKL